MTPFISPKMCLVDVVTVVAALLSCVSARKKKHTHIYSTKVGVRTDIHACVFFFQNIYALLGRKSLLHCYKPHWNAIYGGFQSATSLLQACYICYKIPRFLEENAHKRRQDAIYHVAKLCYKVCYKSATKLLHDLLHGKTASERHFLVATRVYKVAIVTSTCYNESKF